MVGYRVELTSAASRELRHVGRSQLLALRGVILGLGDDPRPRGCRNIVGRPRRRRVRVRIDGVPWRIIYEVRDDECLVVIARVARRDGATYRNLG